MLKIRVERRNETAMVHCLGRIDAGEGLTRLREALISEMSSRVILLDLSRVTAIDAAGLGLLSFLHTRAIGRGCTLKLVAPSPQVMNLLALTRLDSVLIMATAAEAKQMKQPFYDSTNLRDDVACA
ncbi:MAG TPA: STAS domain-containing protein [Terriglobales bacterium]